MKRFIKKVTLLCGISCCAMMLFTVNNMSVYASTASAAEESTVEPRYTNLEWVYKYIDGVLMMRLYNHSTGEWVGDWIPAE